MLGATYFHNDLSNLIGFNGLFDTLNLGAARTQGLETELRARPIDEPDLRGQLHLSRGGKNSAADISQLPGARLPRRPRNEVYVSASYLWFKKLRTTAEAKLVNAREELNFGGPNFDIEDYSFVNFAAEYAMNAHLTIFGRIDNLTNEHYSEVFGFPALGSRGLWRGAAFRFRRFGHPDPHAESVACQLERVLLIASEWIRVCSTARSLGAGLPVATLSLVDPLTALLASRRRSRVRDAENGSSASRCSTARRSARSGCCAKKRRGAGRKRPRPPKRSGKN